MEEPAAIGTVTVGDDGAGGLEDQVGGYVEDAGIAGEDFLEFDVEGVDDELEGGVVLAFQMEAGQTDGNFEIFGGIAGSRRL